MAATSLEVRLTRGKDGYGVRLLEYRGRAYVEGTQGAAAGSALRRGDRVVAVDGNSVESHEAAVRQIRSCPQAVTLGLLRDPSDPVHTAPELRRAPRGLACAALLAIGAIAIGAGGVGSFAPLLATDTLALDGSGAAVDPHAFARRLRANEAGMGRMREERPELARLLEAEPLDVERFQALLRQDKQIWQTAQDLALAEDGSARDPARFIEAVRKNASHMAMLKKDHAEVWQIFRSGDVERLQEMLRDNQRQKELRDGPPPPPPPPTPYDAVGQVAMSMRILTESGEERDLYMLTAEQTDDEKVMVPLHMRCDACQAVAYQGALAVQHAFLSHGGRGLSSVMALDAVQELCDNVSLWTTKYGVVPTKTGTNALTGDGIQEKVEDSLSQDEHVMMQTRHSNEWGRKMANMCSRFLLSADVDEDELFAAVRSAMPIEEHQAASVLKPLLCDLEGQPCYDKLVTVAG
ncbi:hypothetical protein AB1Y20_001682 [Prymnesium parvum]|uniref:PDZ domain-containing protein n=1 Tax=Prymnesium parvum TaxID=97485 RepID=A0AB34KCQ5_PRYPA